MSYVRDQLTKAHKDAAVAARGINDALTKGAIGPKKLFDIAQQFSDVSNALLKLRDELEASLNTDDPDIRKTRAKARQPRRHY